MITQPPPPTVDVLSVTKSNRPIQEVFFSIALLIITVIILLPIPTIPGRDSGVFLYTARQILNGKVPYRDVWDHKPPLVFFIDAFGLFLGNDSNIGVWILELVAISFSALLSFYMLKQHFGLIPAIFGSLSWLITLIYVLQSDNFTEEYALPLQFLALFIFLKLIENKTYGPSGALIGLTFILTFFLKQNVVGIWVAINFSLLVGLGYKRLWRALLNYLIGFGLAALTVTIVVFGYFALNNSLSYFFDSAFQYNFNYASASWEGRLNALIDGFLLLSQSRVAPIALFSWLIVPWYLYSQRSNKDRGWWLILAAFLDLPVEMISSCLSGRLYSHYFISLLPSLAILTTLFCYLVLHKWVPGINQWLNRKQLNKLTQTVQNRLNNLLSLAILVPLLGIMLLVPVFYIQLKFSPSSPSKEETSNTAAIEYINRITSPNNYVLLWGGETHINFVTHRTSPTRFVYQYALFNYPAHRSEYTQEFLDQLNSHKPILIIDSTPAGGNEEVMPPLNAVDRQKWLASGLVVPPSIPAVFDFVEKNYQLTDRLGEQKWAVYKLKSCPGQNC